MSPLDWSGVVWIVLGAVLLLWLVRGIRKDIRQMLALQALVAVALTNVDEAEDPVEVAVEPGVHLH